MPLQLPSQFRRISTAARVYPAPPQFHTQSPLPHLSSHTPPSPPKVAKVGRISRWYLPTMALILVGWLSSPLSPIRQSSDARAGFSAANALEEHNYGHTSPSGRRDRQQERNQQLMDAYGDRMSLAELEKALEAYEVQ